MQVLFQEHEEQEEQEKGTVFENKTFMPQSKKPITVHQKSKLEDFLLENSTIASNKVKMMRLSEYMGHRSGK